MPRRACKPPRATRPAALCGAEGDGNRFELAESAFASAPSIHQLRLYLETMEQVLPGKKKLILDSAKGRRHLLLLEDGVEVAPPGSLGLAP